MSCTDTRWRLNGFLEGSLADYDSELVREHLDVCNSCASAVADSMVRTQPVLEDIDVSQDFTKKLLSHFPEPTVSAVLFRYLCVTFAASVAVGVSIFAIWRHIAHPSKATLADVQWSNLSSLQSSFPWVEHMLNNATFNYMMLALLATILTVILIVVIDHPKQHSVASTAQSKRI